MKSATTEKPSASTLLKFMSDELHCAFLVEHLFLDGKSGVHVGPTAPDADVMMNGVVVNIDEILASSSAAASAGLASSSAAASAGLASSVCLLSTPSRYGPPYAVWQLAAKSTIIWVRCRPDVVTIIGAAKSAN